MGKVPVMGAGYVDEEALQGNTSTDTSSSSSSSASSSAGTSGSGTGTPAATSTGVNTQGVSSMNIDYELLENFAKLYLPVENFSQITKREQAQEAIETLKNFL